uniref:CLAVATA3/ESR-related protein n=1 Tax=Salix viminalis TaxID=40686 RepID=A0A6N2MZZ5_SALVM
MSRLAFVHLLLAWLLLVASQPRFSSVHFKLKPAQLASNSHEGNVLPVWVAEKRIHKSPSGPNPVGNHNPPSKQ